MKNLLFLFLATLTFACNAQNWGITGIEGKGSKVTKTLDIASFHGIGLSINAQVYLRQGSTQSVKVEAQQNILDNIVTKVENGSWKIKFDKNVREHDGVTIWITVPKLTRAAVSGSGDIIGEDEFSGLADLDLAVSGSGSIALDSDSRNLSIAISGSGNIKLGGTTTDCDISISGSGDVEAFNLKTDNCSVKISGSGDANVNASGSLEVAIAGSGDVFYKGSPKVKSRISGSGDVTAK